MGYVIIGLALLLFVQAKNVYPHLLLARLLFSIGGAATSTMVTAILPSMIGNPKKQSEVNRLDSRPHIGNGHGLAPSVSPELTITPHNCHSQPDSHISSSPPSPTRVAGIVGLFTGCGALLALGFFLRLPELIQRTGVEAKKALIDTYYVMGTLSLVLSMVCYVGLQQLSGEEEKGWRALVSARFGGRESGPSSNLSILKSLLKSIKLGFQNPILGLGYLGGFVARASSVGISLFIPLFVNNYYILSGRCDKSGRNPEDIKKGCREAYVLAAELSGTSQLIALLFAPIFGYMADRYRHFNIPLLIAALVGLLGYVGLGTLTSPEIDGLDANVWVYLIMALLGIGQIGAIVCSLGLVGRYILGLEVQEQQASLGSSEAPAISEIHGATNRDQTNASNHHYDEVSEGVTEETPMLSAAANIPRDHQKGSIAGIYSLAGGLGILILTKIGGLLFDRVSPVGPFYLLAFFNGLLLCTGVLQVLTHAWSRKRFLRTR